MEGILLVVIGVGGDWDFGKWVLMGEIVVWWVNFVIVIDDNL